MVNDFGGKELGSLRISILGAGRSGIACANLLQRLGAQVFLSEIKMKEEVENLNQLNKYIATEFGGHSEKILLSDLLVPSPGIHLDIPVIEKAKEKKIPLYSELEIAWRLIKPKLTVAITGTNGKSTTTALVGEIFRSAGEKTVVAGNIGYPLSQAVPEIDAKTIVVLEVSSYQLELVDRFHPQIAVILNITPDHLERHESMKNYSQTKARIYENQTKKDYAVFNADDKYCRELARDCPSQVIFFSRQKKLDDGVFFDGKNISIQLSNQPTSQLSPTLKIPGPHNIENVLSATAISIAAGLSPEIIVKGLNSFKGLEHRLEFVREINRVKFINDSKGTNPDSVLVALKSFSSPIILIMGGRDKGSPYTPLVPLIKEKVRAILLIGEAEENIARELAGTTKIISCGTLDKAVNKAYALASPGEIVLLSPACASFDQFRNFEERGKVFKNLVGQL